MPLRLMQIFVPERNDTVLNELLEGRQVLGTWHDAGVENRLVAHLLVPAEETEAVMDRFEERFAEVEGFHVVLFPIEAVLPRPKVEAELKEVREQRAKAGMEKEAGPRVSRDELYAKVTEALEVTRVYLALAALSAIVAAGGLLRNDTAVIIGAMVIAPLLGPNVAMALATTLGDMTLLRRSLLTNLMGIFAVLLMGIAAGLLFHVDPAIEAIAARTQVDLGHMLLALAAGSAGTFAFTRGLSGAVIGVMVAVALVPPLVTFGMLVGAGHHQLAGAALMLTAVNIICINLAGTATFLAQGVRPRNWWETARAKRATWNAILLWTVLLATLMLILKRWI